MSKRITVADVTTQIWDLMKELGGENTFFVNEINDKPDNPHTFHVKFPNTGSIKISITKEN